MSLALQKKVDVGAEPVIAPLRNAAVHTLAPPKPNYVLTRLLPAAKDWAATIIPPTAFVPMMCELS